jgi:hypothetical protein
VKAPLDDVAADWVGPLYDDLLAGMLAWRERIVPMANAMMSGGLDCP